MRYTPAVGTLLQNHQTKGFYHHRCSSLCVPLSLALSLSLSPFPCVWMWVLGVVVVVLSEIHKGMECTWACVCIFNAISWSHTRARPIRITCYFFRSLFFIPFLASFQSLCLFQWDILRTFCVRILFLFLFLSYVSLSVSHWMLLSLCHRVYTMRFLLCWNIRKSYSGVMVCGVAVVNVWFHIYSRRTHMSSFIAIRHCHIQSKDKQNEYYVI